MSPTPPETENPAADFEAAGTPRVAVIGAGITGLSLTHALAERGVESVSYEATGKVGGVVQSEKIDGHVLEIGPQRLRLTDAIRAMVTDLDIADELVTAADDLPLLVYADGKLREVPRSPKAFLRTDLLSWQAKLRLLAEPLTSDIDPEEPAERAFVRKFGTETYTNLISPIFGGTYGSDPAQMPAKYALKPIMGLEKRDGNLLRPALSRIFFDDGETPPPATFESGLQRLPEALAERYEDRVRMETPVTEIERANVDQDNEDREWLIHTANGTEQFDRVVVTTPAGVTADLVEGVDEASAAALRELNYNPLVLVHLHSKAVADGFGYQVRRTEPLKTLGVTWNASLFGRDGLYTVFMGGMHDPGAIDRDPEELGETAAAEFEQVMGVEAAVLNVARIPKAFPAWDRSWAASERVDLPDGITLATNYTGRMGLPARVREARKLAGELSQ